MKTLSLTLFLVFLAGVTGYLIKVPTIPTVNKIVPIGWVHIQKLLYPLFENVCEESTNPVVVRLSNEFLSSLDSSDYLKPGVFEDLQNLITSKSFLPKGEIFTELNINHLNELKIISEVLISAKNFDTFYKTACWARQNLNCGLFTDALYLAVINRRDTAKIFLAAPYEILPNYFVQKDFIYKASLLLGGEQNYDIDGIREEGNSYVIDANYTTNPFIEDNTDLTYFHEDVGLNSYYFLLKLRNLQWLLNSESTRDNWWGLYLYQSLKQLVTRYDLERYSNGLPELEPLTWKDINEFIYDSNLIYSNGEYFSQINYGNENAATLVSLNNIENNLMTAVTQMRDEGYGKAQILNKLMDILVTSEKSYENLALQVLNKVDSGTRSYSVLSHYMTILRDPLYWKLNKKIVQMVDNALKLLPCYTKAQIYFPGVQVMDITVKKLMTSFESFEFDITDALKTQRSDTKFQVKINQPRLNCKPLSFKINVSSVVNQRALVKIFIGPKISPGQFIEKKNNLMLLDSFETSLKIGTNVITKTSNAINYLSNDFVSLKDVKKYLSDAEFGIEAKSPQFVQSQIEFPARLSLPKGTNEGLPFQIFVFVAPFVRTNVIGSQVKIELNSDMVLSPGYPLDMDIDIQSLLSLPNAFIKDVIITHKSLVKAKSYDGMASNNDWQNSEYTPPENDYYPRYNSLSSKPTYTRPKFDYKAKKGQYGKQTFDTNKALLNNIDEIKINNDNEKTEIEKTVDIQITTEISKDINAFYPEHDSININIKKDKINEVTVATYDDDFQKDSKESEGYNKIDKSFNVDVNKYYVIEKDTNGLVKKDIINKSKTVQSYDDNDNVREKDVYHIDKNKDSDEYQPEDVSTYLPKQRFSSLYDLLKPFDTELKDYVYY